MDSAWVGVIGVAIGAAIGFVGQEFHVRRQHRRRFDEARHLAYTNLIAEAFRTSSAFSLAWSPFALVRERKRIFALQDDVMRAIAAARLLASKPVYEATVELMAAVTSVIQFANGVLGKEARFGVAGWYLFLKPLPVARHPGLEEVMDKLERATTRFIVEAQKEIRVGT